MKSEINSAHSLFVIVLFKNDLNENNNKAVSRYHKAIHIPNPLANQIQLLSFTT